MLDSLSTPDNKIGIRTGVTLNPTTTTAAGGTQQGTVCLKAGDGTAANSPTTYHSTGVDIIIGVPTVLTVNYRRVVKSAAVTYTLTGAFLSKYAMKIKIAEDCTTNTDSGDVITGGDGVNLATATGTKDTTGGTIAFTLTQSLAAAQKVCITAPAAQGGTATYADVRAVTDSNGGTVTVVDVTKAAGYVHYGAVQAGGLSTTAVKLATGSSTVDDYYNGLQINVMKSDLTVDRGTKVISDYDGTSKVVTCAALDSSAVAGDIYKITQFTATAGEGTGQNAATAGYIGDNVEMVYQFTSTTTMIAGADGDAIKFESGGGSVAAGALCGTGAHDNAFIAGGTGAVLDSVSTPDNKIGIRTGVTLNPTEPNNAGVTKQGTVCLKAGDGTAANSPTTYHSTGVDVIIGQPSITAVNYNRVVKSASATYTITGKFLSDYAMTVKIASSCDANGSPPDQSISANVVTGGDGKVLTSTSGDGQTSAQIVFVLDAAASAAKVCLMAPSAQGGGDEYAVTSGADIVSVIDVTTVSGFVSYGTIASATDNKQFVIASTASTSDDYYNGLQITVGSNAAKVIDDYVGSSKTVTLSTANALSGSPSAGDIYKITALTTTAGVGTGTAANAVAYIPNNVQTFYTLQNGGTTAFVGEATHGDAIKFSSSSTVAAGTACGANAGDSIITGGTGSPLVSEASGVALSTGITLNDAGPDNTGVTKQSTVCLMASGSSVGGTHHSGSLQSAASATSFVLATGASATDSAYKGMAITVGSVGTAIITAYVGSSKTVTVAAGLTGTPGGTDSYTIKLSAPNTYHSTGIDIVLGEPSITAINYDRVVKGDIVQFTATGKFLSIYATKLRVGSACSGASATGNIITGGDGIAFTSVTGDGQTSGSITYTLDQASTNAKFCLYAPPSQGGNGAYTVTSNADVVSVLSITAVDTTDIGKDVMTLQTYTTAGPTLTTSDKVQWSAANDCAAATTGGTMKTLASATEGHFRLNPADSTTVYLCLQAGAGSPHAALHYTGVSAIVKIPKITAYTTPTSSLGGTADAVDAEVATVFTLTGYGLNKELQLLVAEATASDCATLINGGSGRGGTWSSVQSHAVTTPTQNAKQATVTLTLKKAFVNAKLCLKVPTGQGGSGVPTATQANSLTVTVIGSLRSLDSVDNGANYFAGRTAETTGTIGFAPPRVQAKTGGGAAPFSFDSSGLQVITASIATNGGANTQCNGNGGANTAGSLTAGTTCGRLDIGVIGTANTASSFTLASSASTVADSYKGSQITVTSSINGVSQSADLTGGGISLSGSPSDGSYTLADTQVTIQVGSASTKGSFASGNVMTVVVSSNSITSITILDAGSGFLATNVLRLAGADIGGATGNTDITLSNDFLEPMTKSETRTITGYTNARVVTVSPAFSTYGTTLTPLSTSAYTVFQMDFSTTGAVGTVTTQSQFKLANTAATVAHYYRGMTITIGGESRTISSYQDDRTVITSSAFSVHTVTAADAYFITEANLAANEGYADAAVTQTKTRVCSFPSIIFDTYGEGYVLRWVAGTASWFEKNSLLAVLRLALVLRVACAPGPRPNPFSIRIALFCWR